MTILEIGPGRGDFLFHLAEKDPPATFIGIEYKKKRFDKLIRRLEKRDFSNVRFYWGDARSVLPQEFDDGTFDQIYILFSDPWPKRRHAKHRLFQELFVRELGRVLGPKGRVFIAHDDPDYVDQIKATFRQCADLFLYSNEGVDFKTFYAEKWKKEGRKLQSFSYIKFGLPSRENISLPCRFPQALTGESDSD